MSTRYQLEGRDEDGQWSWSHISADDIEANTILDTAEEAEAAGASWCGSTDARTTRSAWLRSKHTGHGVTFLLPPLFRRIRF